MNFLKNFFLLLVVVGLFQGLALAQTQDVDREEQINEQIIKIQNEIDRLETKLKGAELSSKRIELRRIIEGHKARLKKLEAELEEILDALLEEVATPEVKTRATPEVAPFEVEFTTEEALPAEEPGVSGKKRFEFEIGAATGLFAATTGFIGEIRLPLSYVVGPATSTLRVSGGLVQSEDTDRKYAVICGDGVLNFPPESITGVENYAGVGLNYVVLTTGRKTGTIGGEIFYGVEGTGFGGKLFGEIGWGILRTGFSASHKGTTLLIGYRRDWGF